jgi:hypothetical protein
VRAIVPGLSGLGKNKEIDRILALRGSQGWRTASAASEDFETIDPY